MFEGIFTIFKEQIQFHNLAYKFLKKKTPSVIVFINTFIFITYYVRSYDIGMTSVTQNNTCH